MVPTPSSLPLAKRSIEPPSHGSCSMVLIPTAVTSLRGSLQAGRILGLRSTMYWEPTCETRKLSMHALTSCSMPGVPRTMTNQVSSPRFAAIPSQSRNCCMEIVRSSREDIRLSASGPRPARMLTLKGATLLHVAAEFGQVEVATLLLDAGADVNAPALTGLVWARRPEPDLPRRHAEWRFWP